ncbi:MAG: HetP family heterocyst commitment protein [Microcoleaceae cyanobacterium]|jgi:hypothetical protein
MMSNLRYSTNRDQTSLNQNQLDEIVTAILAGKYSWACFLLLRHVGYNPLDYIPYRTYNRLIKDNMQVQKSSNNHVCPMVRSNERQPALSKITDLDHLDTINERAMAATGGYLDQDDVENLLISNDNSLQGDVGTPSASPGFFAEFKTRLFHWFQ